MRRLILALAALASLGLVVPFAAPANADPVVIVTTTIITTITPKRSSSRKTIDRSVYLQPGEVSGWRSG